MEYYYTLKVTNSFNESVFYHNFSATDDAAYNIAKDIYDTIYCNEYDTWTYYKE